MKRGLRVRRVRVASVHVNSDKRVSASLTWAPAVVLFGRNDVGKSNILEAISWTGGEGVGRTDPLLDSDAPSVHFLVELELEGADSHDDGDDAQLLAALLQMRHVPPLFPYVDPDEPRPDPDREADRWGPGIYMSQFPASLLRWDFGGEEADDADTFKLGCVGGMYSGGDPVNTVGSLDDVRQALRARALDYAGDLSDGSGEHGDVAALFALLFERCLRSKWLLCDAEAGVVWLAPTREECDEAEIDAARRLAGLFPDERIPILDPFIRQLASGEPAWTRSSLSPRHTPSAPGRSFASRARRSGSSSSAGRSATSSAAVSNSYCVRQAPPPIPGSIATSRGHRRSAPQWKSYAPGSASMRRRPHPRSSLGTTTYASNRSSPISGTATVTDAPA